MSGPTRFLGWLVIFIVALVVLSVATNADTWDVVALAAGLSAAVFSIELVLTRRKAHRSQFEEYRRRARKREKPPE